MDCPGLMYYYGLKGAQEESKYVWSKTSLKICFSFGAGCHPAMSPKLGVFFSGQFNKKGEPSKEKMYEKIQKNKNH